MSISTVVSIAICSFFGGSIVGAYFMLIIVLTSKHFENQEYTEKNDFFDTQDGNTY